MRADSRSYDALRPVDMTVGFHRPSEGSVLYRAGGTVVLCTASVDAKVPPFLENAGKGWVTGEYQMHPRANLFRESRDGRGKAPSGRTVEIQRLIGRSLRAAVDTRALGPSTITIDCDVLEADGGTRTASITGAFVALALAISKGLEKGLVRGPCLRAPVAATSVGWLERKHVAVDLCYKEDSTADVDLNVVANGDGAVIEVQGTAEGEPIARPDLDRLIDAALGAIAQLVEKQKATLHAAGVDLAAITAPSK